jgi:hypothetical protein
MKSTTFRTVVATAVCSGALVSYVVAGPGHNHQRANSRKSGAVLSATNNPALLGSVGKDQPNNFFVSPKSSSVQVSALGKSAAGNISSKPTLQQNNNLTTTTPKFFFSGDWIANAKPYRPNPVPNATPSRGISAIPSATPFRLQLIQPGIHPVPGP